MDETYSLMEFLQALATDTGLRDRFTHDPQVTLHHYGLDHLSPADVHDALVLVEDNQTADFSRDYDTGPGWTHLPPPPADHQQIDTGGGHFDQWVDVDSTVASGAGAVAAGGDIRGSTITGGDHSAFGSGNATHIGGDLDVGDAAAFASGGGTPVDHSPRDVGDTWTDDPVHGSYLDAGDHSVHDAGPHDAFDDERDEHVSTDDGQHHVGDVDLH